MTRPRIGHAVLAIALALSAVACGDDAANRAGSRTTSSPAASASTYHPEPAVAYEVPTTHASDWGAPDVALPDITFPYGRSPKATADPSFYDVTTLDPTQVAAAKPGHVLRVQPMVLTGPLAGASGWRVLYRSTTADGAPAVGAAPCSRPPATRPRAGDPSPRGHTARPA